MCFSLSPPYLPMRACITCVCVCVCVWYVSLRLAPSQPHAITRRSVGATSTHFLCNRLVVAGGRCRFSIVRSCLITALAEMRERGAGLSISAASCTASQNHVSLLHISALTRSSRSSQGSRFPCRGARRGIDSSRYLVRAYGVRRGGFPDLDRSPSR